MLNFCLIWITEYVVEHFLQDLKHAYINRGYQRAEYCSVHRDYYHRSWDSWVGARVLLEWKQVVVT